MSVDASAATVVCVLGTSRAGTSLTTRVLNLAGVYLGPEEELLQRPGEVNPKGFWEHYRIMRLNERILRAFGGSWREPPELPAGWERSEKLDAERDEARTLLAESFGERRLWGWKDPRNSLTLPFWQALLPGMRYVVCLRNPLDVAASLQRRDGLPHEQAVDLWMVYVARALVNTSGGPRLLLPYESHFADPQGTAKRLAAFAGQGQAFDDADSRRLLAETVDEGLWRHRTAAEDVVADVRLPLPAASLHLITELLAAGEGRWIDGEEAEVVAAVNRLAARLLDFRRAG
ncbi:MAG TPA: sulfotransferase [Solirubrobacterales bacterium]|nr:sulfotransferase [Solirubrobacterales bacterium]